MADDDFLAEMGKNKGGTESDTKGTVNKVTGKNSGKQPGPPASQQSPYGKGGKDGGKGGKK